MASQKVIDNSNRLRYVRALERFHKSIISYLQNTAELSESGYAKKIESSLKVLQKVEETSLYKGDLQDLQKLIFKMINFVDSDKDISEIKEELIYTSNQLEKTKNARRYKKDKHSQSKFDDWE
ncbi:hypothetical protein [Sulfurimonas sp.]|uniref:hypothetical protein n=1 Tax=Sulfurimonas sp. TaxID=2022749 RepID=UPI0025FF5167|nr:hypothetical protein [Sulfurimonas sp.]MDD5156495.1 hypothetical protein [Sulfurimonas sp.]